MGRGGHGFHGGFGGGFRGCGGPWGGPFLGPGLLFPALVGGAVAGGYYAGASSRRRDQYYYQQQQQQVAVPQGQLVVTLHRADGLEDVAWTGKMDVVVEFFLYEMDRVVATGRSFVVKAGGESPVWPPGASLAFPVPATSNVQIMSLVARVKAKNSLMDDTVVGTAVLASSLEAVIDGLPRDAFLDTRGALTFTCTYTPPPALVTPQQQQQVHVAHAVAVPDSEQPYLPTAQPLDPTPTAPPASPVVVQATRIG